MINQSILLIVGSLLAIWIAGGGWLLPLLVVIGFANASGADDKLLAPEAASFSRSAIVSVFTFDQLKRPAYHAVAFFISEDGVLASPRHILDDASDVRIITADGETLPLLGIAAEDPVHDLVLLRVKRSHVSFFKLSAHESLRVGAEVSIEGDGHGGVVPSTKGVIAFVDNLADDYRWFSVTAKIQAGLSGCPVIDSSGRVTGMIRAQLHNFNQGFAVSADAISKLSAGKLALRPVSEFRKRLYDELFDDLDFKAAMSASGRRDYNQAAQYMSRAAERFPKSGACLALLGSFYSHTGAWREAGEAFSKATTENPNYSFGWASLGAVAANRGDEKQAAAACLRAIELNPTLPDTWINIGMASLKLRRSDLARYSLPKLRSANTREANGLADKLEALISKGADVHSSEHQN